MRVVEDLLRIPFVLDLLQNRRLFRAKVHLVRFVRREQRAEEPSER